MNNFIHLIERILFDAVHYVKIRLYSRSREYDEHEYTDPFHTVACVEYYRR